MKKIKTYLVLIFIFISCDKKTEKPKLTALEYKKQSIVMIGVVNKILSSEIPKEVHLMARSIEESRAVNCIPVKNECDLYYQLINKIVNVTQENQFKAEDKVIVYQLFNELKKTTNETEKKIDEDWKNYSTSLSISE